MAIEYKQGNAALVMVKLVTTSTGTPAAGVIASAISATVMRADGTATAVSVSNSNWAEITTGSFSGQGVYALTLPSTVINQPGILAYAVSSSTIDTYTGICKVVANEAADIYARQGAPAGASMSADIAAIATTTTSTNTRVGAPVSTSISADIAAIRGADNRNLTEMAGSGFVTAQDSLHNIKGTVQTTTNNIQTSVNTIGTNVNTISTNIGGLFTDMERIKKLTEGRWKIHVSGALANHLVIYDTDGVTPLVKFLLKDGAGDATYINSFERLPVP